MLTRIFLIVTDVHNSVELARTEIGSARDQSGLASVLMRQGTGVEKAVEIANQIYEVENYDNADMVYV